MSKPLATQTAFAGLAPPWQLNQLDANFTNLTNLVNDWGTYSLYLLDTGAVNALQVAINSPLTVALVDGLTLDVKVANTTTSSSPTLQVNALGAAPIKNGDGSVLLGALVAGGIYRIIYSASASAWLLVNFLAGSTVIKTKAAITSRASTVTLANDPDLVISIPAAGIYRYEVLLNAMTPGASGNTPGIQWAMNYTGSIDAAASTSFYLMWGFGSSTVAPITAGIFGAPVGEPLQGANQTGNSFTFLGSLKATTSGTFSVQWAQNLSSTNATILLAGSYFIVTKLA